MDSSSSRRVVALKTHTSSLWTIEKFLSKEECTLLVDHVKSQPFTHHPQSFLFGRPIVFHRDIAFFSDFSEGYRYSGQMTKAQPMTPELNTLLERINNALGTTFNAWLVNKYANGDDYISPHSDDESHLASGCVACISFGSSRVFRVKSKSDKDVKLDISTSNGQLLVMDGNFQKEFTHGIPATKTLVGERISLTARYHSK